ncbi:hypothetical protein FDUTEX481_07266 [Tolypothrix sp. PCC 7601]|nr:hypothetical protein FDUTEX481_07266 [Tolypothrix sp. PCC 7601]
MGKGRNKTINLSKLFLADCEATVLLLLNQGMISLYFERIINTLRR